MRLTGIEESDNRSNVPWRSHVSDKGSITVLLDALPVSAKLILSVPRERTAQPD